MVNHIICVHPCSSVAKSIYYFSFSSVFICGLQFIPLFWHNMNKNRTLKLILEYDGADFAGWQIQPNIRTVQNVIEESLEQILGHTVSITGAGRTDAGVHATGQVAGFTTSSAIETSRLKRSMNGILPPDITVIDISDAPSDFNARFDAVLRTYRYTLSDRPLSVGRAYAWYVKYPLKRELLELSTRQLNGGCNLRGFSKGNEKDDFSTVIAKNSWTFRDNFIIFEISAIRFFHHAVRSIVGSAVEVGREKESPDFIQRILETGDRSLAGPTAPAQGLCLVKVDYGGNNGA